MKAYQLVFKYTYIPPIPTIYHSHITYGFQNPIFF